jgi:hypothetical protein
MYFEVWFRPHAVKLLRWAAYMPKLLTYAEGRVVVVSRHPE